MKIPNQRFMVEKQGERRLSPLSCYIEVLAYKILNVNY